MREDKPPSSSSQSTRATLPRASLTGFYKLLGHRLSSCSRTWCIGCNCGIPDNSVWHQVIRIPAFIRRCRICTHGEIGKRGGVECNDEVISGNRSRREIRGNESRGNQV